MPIKASQEKNSSQKTWIPAAVMGSGAAVSLASLVLKKQAQNKQYRLEMANKQLNDAFGKHSSSPLSELRLNDACNKVNKINPTCAAEVEELKKLHISRINAPLLFAQIYIDAYVKDQKPFYSAYSMLAKIGAGISAIGAYFTFFKK